MRTSDQVNAYANSRPRLRFPSCPRHSLTLYPLYFDALPPRFLLGVFKTIDQLSVLLR
jgi:hypothetical protein